MSGDQAIKTILRGAVVFSVGMAWLSPNFEKAFSDIWASIGTMITAVVVVEFVVVSLVKSCQWLGRRFGSE